MADKFLDASGVDTLWKKVKVLVSTGNLVAGSYANYYLPTAETLTTANTYKQIYTSALYTSGGTSFSRATSSLGNIAITTSTIKTIRIRAQIYYGSPSAGVKDIVIRKNGLVIATGKVNTTGTYNIIDTEWIGDVVSGDVFSLWGRCGTASAVIAAGSAITKMSLEVLR